MYATQCNDIISNIVFIRMFLTLFWNKNNYYKIRLIENWNRYFSNNIILKIILNTLTFIQILFFTSWSTPCFGMLLSKLSNRNTHVCTSSIRKYIRFHCCRFFSLRTMLRSLAAVKREKLMLEKKIKKC